MICDWALTPSQVWLFSKNTSLVTICKKNKTFHKIFKENELDNYNQNIQSKNCILSPSHI